ncbi:Uncharacterized protein dnl_22450 [Desulfonema limicola]|uniref:Uncharacterized protein n=1 Tax=Desulfonema limicola TaxID=45656 RepID=A0A975B6X8_9BACT|nr:Uncharacterized protein dnl_22450 [Desulfonema limicola]
MIAGYTATNSQRTGLIESDLYLLSWCSFILTSACVAQKLKKMSCKTICG